MHCFFYKLMNIEYKNNRNPKINPTQPQKFSMALPVDRGSICHHLSLGPAASIWFEIWGVVHPGPKNFDFLEKFTTFSGNFTKKINFSVQISEKFRFFSGNLTKNFDFSKKISEEFRSFKQFPKKFRFSRKISEKFLFLGNFKKNFGFSRQKLVIYMCYSWANYSIALQKSPLSNTLPVHDKI